MTPDVAELFSCAAARDEKGRFAHPWPIADGPVRGLGDVLRWQLQRLRQGGRPDTGPVALRRARHAIAMPRTGPGELRITWVGHATFLIQIDGVNIVTDPVWGLRASPFRFAGPARLTPPGLPLDALPPLDAVLLSHDHYDHLDVHTVRALHRRFGDGLTWIAPLGFAEWLRGEGVTRVAELDWWQRVEIGTPAGALAVRALPAQHWTKRTAFDERRRLWAAFSLRLNDGAATFFCGDSGYFGGFRAIGEAEGPFEACLLPIGAYDPRWFMKPVHMSPEEAVRAWLDLGGAGTFVGMHWGTFQLTDEPPMEPPRRARAAWAEAGLPPGSLWLPIHGETRLLRQR